MKLVRREQTGTICFSDGAPELVQRVFAMRGIHDASEISFELKNLYPVSALKGIKTATQLLLEAIEAQQRILIVGDFDADGATSTALAIRALNMMGHTQVNYLVPNRFEYGYGLTPEIVVEAGQFDPDLIITVDNGISSLPGVAKAKSRGYRVIITDHHLPGEVLPEADAIVNPNQPGDDFPSGNLAGVGVIFYLMLALKNALQQKHYFVTHDIPVPNLAELLDLVALGTVADVVPLDRNNRILVEQGLRRIRVGKCSPGIAALFHIAGRNPARAVSSDLGFVCGPRLNAAGRLDDMSLGIECLLRNDYQQAFDLASTLDDLNVERRAIEEGMKAEATHILADLDKDGMSASSHLDGEIPPILCLFKENWHQGVIGILAARIRERFNRPAIIFALADPGRVHIDTADKGRFEIKGSARSIPGLHMRDLLDTVATNNPGLLDKFGGHAMAAGLSLKKSQFETFVDAITKAAYAQVDKDSFEEIHHSDGELQSIDFDMKNADALRYAAPWGQHFPPPQFDNRFKIIQKRLLKEKHLKLLLRPTGKGFCSARNVAAIAFNVEPARWPDENSEVHLLFRLDVNEFRDTCSLQLIVEKLLG